MTIEPRVLHVIDSLTASGAETSLLEMIGPLRARHIDVHVCHLGQIDTLAPQMRSAGATVWSPQRRSRGRIGNVRQVRDVIRSVKPALVHTTLFEADIAGRAAARSMGVPVISSIVNEMYGDAQLSRVPSVARLRLAQGLDIATARTVDLFHAISQDVASRMSPRLRLDVDKIVVIPRGRSFERLGRRSHERREATRKRIGASQSERLLLIAAREEPQKDIPTAIAGIARLVGEGVNARLVLAGRRGTDSARIDETIAKLALTEHVIRLGPRDDIADLLSAADLLLAPSLWEGLGGVLIEAMALECQIVCSDLPVFREVTDGTHAAYFAPGDSAALADSCLAALDAVAPRSLQHARDFAFNRYDIGSVADQFGTMYQRVLSR